MAETTAELAQRIEEQRTELARLEAEYAERVGATSGGETWPPRGFYLTYHVVAGLLLGILGSITSFLMNVVGSIAIEQDPLLFLRVYGTFFLGMDALTATDLDFFMLVAVVHFSVGAVAGAVFQVGVSFFVPERPLLHLGLGAAYGLLMWAINFYVIIAWVQASVFGEAHILALMPAGVAAVTHVVYGLTIGGLQPLGRFVPYQPAEAR